MDPSHRLNLSILWGHITRGGGQLSAMFETNPPLATTSTWKGRLSIHLFGNNRILFPNHDPLQGHLLITNEWWWELRRASGHRSGRARRSLMACYTESCHAHGSRLAHSEMCMHKVCSIPEFLSKKRPPEWDEAADAWRALSIYSVTSSRTCRDSKVHFSLITSACSHSNLMMVVVLFFCFCVWEIKQKEKKQNKKQPNWSGKPEVRLRSSVAGKASNRNTRHSASIKTRKLDGIC